MDRDDDHPPRVAKAMVRTLSYAETVAALSVGRALPARVPRWYVVRDLPAGTPHRMEYLRKNGAWSFSACHSAVDEPDSAYFETRAEAESAMLAVRDEKPMDDHPDLLAGVLFLALIVAACWLLAPTHAGTQSPVEIAGATP